MVVYTMTIDAINAVPNETLTKYSAAICHPKFHSNKICHHPDSELTHKQSAHTFPFSNQGSILILTDLAASFDL